MSYYEVLLFLHILAAIIWLGSSFLLHALLYRAKRTNDSVLIERISANTEWLTRWIFIPVTFAVLVLGILLTIEGPWSFGMLWIVLGLAGLGVIIVLGLGVIEPEGKRLGAVAVHGPEHPEVQWRTRRIDALMTLDLVLLVLLVFDMTVKPAADDVAALVLMGVGLTAGVAYTLNVLRAPAPDAAVARQPQPAP